MKNKIHYLLLLIPIIFVILFFTQHIFIYRSLISLSCAIILIIFPDKRLKKYSCLLISSGLFISIFADWFMANSKNADMNFIYGVALFFVAHCCYLLFSLQNGKMNYKFLILLLIGYLSFFFIFLSPGLNNSIVYIAVMMYLLISCLSLAAASGLTIGGPTRWIFTLGIALIAFSDTVIGLNSFTPYKFNGIVLPTYFAFQIVMTAALLKK